MPANTEFQPTLPARGATCTCAYTVAACPHFNPRSPHGERRGIHAFSSSKFTFQPTLPARGATAQGVGVAQNAAFQPTLPARGATSSILPPTAWTADFNPRSPHGERLLDEVRRAIPPEDFNPRSPHGERPDCAPSRPVQPYFNPRSPHGERLVEFEHKFLY